MYDFKNAVVNKLLLILACFIAFVIVTLLLPTVVTTVLTIGFLWAVCGLAGWSMGRLSGKVEDEVDVPFYKEVEFYEYIARGPITLIKYFK